MKRFLLFVLAAVAFAACEQAPIEEAQGVVMSDRSLEVSFEGSDDTRIQLQNGKTVWTKGDHVSVFYRSAINEEWQFMGETGDRTGQIVPVDNSVNPPATHNHVVVAYPYSADYFYNTETHNVEALLPAVQSYMKDSYGTNGNIMISSSEFNKVSLKSVCGWLKLQLTGDGEVVKSITLRGNDGEQVAGLIYVDSAAATATLASASGEAGDGEVGGTLVRPGTILTEVTLDCGEGVALGKNATAFYIALPPQTFEQGFTVEIEDTEGYVMEQSTDKALIIERNTIKPMAALEFINPNPPTQPTPASNQIWYTATEKADPYFDDFVTFGSNVDSNVWNSETKRGIFTFDGDVTMIGDYAFYNCNQFTSITLPESVTSIGKNAFYDCDGLTEFAIPDSVTEIGDSAFSYCDSLTSVNIPDSVTTIGDYVFWGCTSLTEFTSKFAEDNGRILVVDGVLTAFAPAGITEYNIPDGVTSIGEWAFGDCDSLTSVNIPDSVTTIGYSAFEGCDSLKKVYCYATIPPALGYDAFSYNASGRRIYVYEECVEVYKSAWSDYKDSIYTNGKNCPETITIVYTSSDGNVVTPYNTNVFGANIISNTYNNGMGIITFDGDVTTIGNYAFYNCDSLTSVNIPDSVTEIGDYAFYECDSLTSVNIPDSVTTIGNYAFCDCTSLISVNIPDSVTTIEICAFYNCTSLTEFTGKFAEDNGRILVVDGVLTAFAPAGLTEYTIPNSVTSIGYGAFYNCTGLTSVDIPDSVTSIGEYAFEHCDSLTSVNIPDSVTTIGEWAFYNCTSLTSVNIPDSVTSIGEYAFYYCTSLTSVTIPDSVTTIGYCAFYFCTSLTSVNIPDSVTTIGSSAFERCDSLISVNIPDSVTEIGSSAFRDCDSLTSVNIGDSVTTIGNSAFRNCESLTSVNIPDSVTEIGEGVFDWCTNLTSVTIGGSVTSIGEGAFYGCTSLTSVNIPDSVTSIRDYAFFYCTSLTSVNIPDSVTSIGDYAFAFCTSLTSVYCKSTTPPALDGTSVFDNNGSSRKIYVPAGSVEAYKSATNWSKYASAIVDYNF